MQLTVALVMRLQSLLTLLLALPEPQRSASQSPSALALVQKGEEDFAYGRVGDAVKAWEEATAIDPNQATAHMHLGLTYRDLGQRARAATALEAAARADPKSPTPHYHLASLATGPFEAASFLRKAADRDPSCAEIPVHQSLAAALHMTGQIDEATAILTRLLSPWTRSGAHALMPAPPLSWDDVLRLADCQEKMFDLITANATLHSLIGSGAPSQVKANAATKLSFILLALADNMTAAMEMAALATSLNPKSADAQVALGLAFDATTGTVDDSEHRNQMQLEADKAFAAALANKPAHVVSVPTANVAASASSKAVALAVDMLLASRRPFPRTMMRAFATRHRAPRTGRDGEEGGALGGWGGPKLAEGIRALKCNIERREISSLTAEQLQKEYIDDGKPVILQHSGGAENGDGVAAAFAAPRWTRTELLGHYGHLPVDVLRSSDVVADQRWRAHGLRQNITMSLRDFVETAMGDTKSAAKDLQGTVPSDGLEAHGQTERGSKISKDPLYIFSSESLEGIAADLEPPELFAPASPWLKERYEWDEAERQSHALFFLGPSGSGTWFHQHYDGTILLRCCYELMHPPFAANCTHWDDANGAAAAGGTVQHGTRSFTGANGGLCYRHQLHLACTEDLRCKSGWSTTSTGYHLRHLNACKRREK